MTQQIIPSSGQGALFTQQGPGTTPGYSALDDRRSNSGSLQEGVYGVTQAATVGGVAGVAYADFMVTQRGVGVNMSVDVNCPPGCSAYVQGDTINGQGLYCVPGHSGNINEVIAAADPTNPRIDQVILEIQDNVLDASGGNLARTRVLTGTPTGGATLANRSGAVALPGSALLLGDILVAAGASSIANSAIRDRRKWARGAFARVVRTAGDLTASVTTAYLQISSTLQVRVECSGAPMRLKLRGRWQMAGAANIFLSPRIDSAADGSVGDWYSTNSAASGNELPLNAEYEFIPSPGSHLLEFYWRNSAGIGSNQTLSASTTTPAVLTVEEEVRQVAANSNGVTTG